VRLLVFLSILFCFSSFASNEVDQYLKSIENLSAQERTTLRAKLEIRSIIYKHAIREADQLNELTAITFQDWSNVYQRSYRSSLTEIAQHHPHLQSMINEVGKENFFQKLNFTHLANASDYIKTNTHKFISSVGRSTKTYLRLKGIRSALIFGINYAIKFGGMFALAKIGRPDLAAGFGFFFSPVTSTSVTNVALNKFSHQKFVKTVGGKEVYKKFIQARQAVLDDFKAKGKDHILLFLRDGEDLISFKTQEHGKVKKVVSWFKSTDELTWKNLKTELKLAQYNPNSLSILDNSKLPKEFKTALVLEEIFQSSHTELKAKLKLRFQSNFKAINQMVGEPIAAVKWIDDFLRASNVSDIPVLFRNFPNDISPAQFVELWEEVLEKEFARNLDDISVGEFRKLRAGFKDVKALTIIEPNMSQKLFKTRFLEFLDRVLPNHKICSYYLSSI
jgi:hypothetical protein